MELKIVSHYVINDTVCIWNAPPPIMLKVLFPACGTVRSSRHCEVWPNASNLGHCGMHPSVSPLPQAMLHPKQWASQPQTQTSEIRDKIYRPVLSGQ